MDKQTHQEWLDGENEPEPPLRCLKRLIDEGFMTANSDGEGNYYVTIDMPTLKKAHELHRALCNLKAT